MFPLLLALSLCRGTVAGEGDPRKSLRETLPGKLPQRKLCQTAAAGYSSYGNQIGLATGHVAELYHDGYVAKRLECSAVVAAAPAYNVRRERPAPGDVVILLGGRTGRDGIGGATGSSKSHNAKSLTAVTVWASSLPTSGKPEAVFMSGRCIRIIRFFLTHFENYSWHPPRRADSVLSCVSGAEHGALCRTYRTRGILFWKFKIWIIYPIIALVIGTSHLLVQ